MAAARILIVANPAAGSVTPTLVWELVRVCGRQPCRVSVRWTTGPSEAFRVAESCVDDWLVAVGGDDTVLEMTAGLAAGWSRASLLIVPGGRTNSRYRKLHGDTEWQSIVESALAADRMAPELHQAS